MGLVEKHYLRCSFFFKITRTINEIKYEVANYNKTRHEKNYL